MIISPGPNMQKTILCDWIDEVSHYNLPMDMGAALKKKCAEYNVRLEFIKNSEEVARPDVVACLGNKFTQKDLQFFKNIRWIQFGSIGTDKIPRAYAKERNLLVTNARGVFEAAVARHTLYLILDTIIRKPSRPQFNRKSFEIMNDYTWPTIKFLILGTGPIAQLVAKYLNNMDLDTFIINRHNSKHPLEPIETHESISRFQNEDVAIINLLPANDNQKFVDKDYLSRFSNIISYVNVGRIETENTEDVINLLSLGTIKNAAWDVIRDQDLHNVLINQFCDRVVMTPHVASFNAGHWSQLAELVSFNLHCFLANRITQMKNRCYD